MTGLTAANDAQHGKVLKKKLIGGGNIREPKGVPRLLLASLRNQLGALDVITR